MDSARLGGVCFNFKKQKTGTNRLPQPGQLSFYSAFAFPEGESRECLGLWINSSAVHEAKKRAFAFPEGESRECLGSWINSSAVHEAKKRAKQVISCSFPCGKWLHMIGARASPGYELCKRERRMDMTLTDALPIETVATFKAPAAKRRRKV